MTVREEVDFDKNYNPKAEIGEFYGDTKAGRHNASGTTIISKIVSASNVYGP